MASPKFDLSDFRLDKGAKEEGIWIPFGGDARFKIAAFDNPAFTSAFKQAIEPYQALGREVPEEEQEEIMCRCMSQHIVLDWEKVFDNEEPFPYSSENAYKLLSELEWLRKRIMEESMNLGNFREKKREETTKN